MDETEDDLIQAEPPSSRWRSRPVSANDSDTKRHPTSSPATKVFLFTFSSSLTSSKRVTQCIPFAFDSNGPKQLCPSCLFCATLHEAGFEGLVKTITQELRSVP